MTKMPMRLLGACLLFVTGIALADIPGVFVVQESRIAEPYPTASFRNGFGASQMQWVGDLNKDGVQDFITGVPMHFDDSGALMIYKLGKSGAVSGSPILIAARDPVFIPMLSKTTTRDRFGDGVAVLKPFSSTENCAVVMTSSANVAKVWAVRICRDGANGVVVDAAKAVDTVTVLKGSIGKIGSAMEIVDTLPSGEIVVAVGAPLDGVKSTDLYGQVQILAVDPIDLSMRRLGKLIDTWGSSSDIVGKNVAASSRFGCSLARIGKSSGTVRLAVLACKDQVNGTAIGRTHFVDLSISVSESKVIADKVSPIFAGVDTLKEPYSISAADFDHDGVMDLLVGQAKANNLQTGGFAVATIGATGDYGAVKSFSKGVGGFIDTANTLGEKSYLGYAVLAGDFDGDSQIDALVGQQGSAAAVPERFGSVWALRMKAKPWRHKEPVQIDLSLNVPEKTIDLSEYVTGNNLLWSITDLSNPQLATCAVGLVSGNWTMTCRPGKTNGLSRFQLVASDAGNVGTPTQFAETLIFPVMTAGMNVPPAVKKALPDTIFMDEDQAATEVISMRDYFVDPDEAVGKELKFTVTPVDAVTKTLFGTSFPVFANALSLRPTPLASGVAKFTVEAKDYSDAIVNGTLVVKVRHINHAPTTKNDSVMNLVESISTAISSATVDVKANDGDLDVGDILVVTIATAPQNGKAVVDASGKVVYTPKAFFLGLDSLQYKLSDGIASSLAWVKFKTVNSSVGLMIHKPLPNTTVSEGANPIDIKVDSLFFSGAIRFEVPVFEATIDCKSATVSHDRTAKSIRITLAPYASGTCVVSIVESSPSRLKASMTLTILGVPSPYAFAKDLDRVNVEIGKTTMYRLDSLNHDNDTLEFTTVKPLPSWVKMGRFNLSFSPNPQSIDDTIRLVVHKKATPPNYLNPTDTLILIAQLGDGVKIYRDLRDTIVQESAKPIEIRLDSLFFSGTLRFAVPVDSSSAECPIATVVHDRKASKLLITPRPYESGTCILAVQEAVTHAVKSSMTLTIKSVVNPYSFPKDADRVELNVGVKVEYPLDSIDLDRDTLAYSTKPGTLPNWIQLNRFKLTFTPDDQSLDQVIVLYSYKKSTPQKYANPTDSLILSAQFGTASIRGRHIGSGKVRLDFAAGKMRLSGSGVSFGADILGFDGRVLGSVMSEGNNVVVVDVRNFPRVALLRLSEGRRITLVPLFIRK